MPFWIVFVLFWMEGVGAEPEPLWRMGVVPQLATREVHRVWEPIVSALEGRLPARLRLEIPPDIPAFERGLEAGRYHLAYANPAHYVRVADRYRPLLRDHGRALRGVLVVARDGPVEGLHQLQDRRLVFPRHAFAASLLLRRTLHRKGVRFTAEFLPDHASVYWDVALGRHVAGGGVEATLERQPARLRERLRVLHRTPAVPPHPLLVHRRLSAQEVEAVAAAFMALAREAPALLAAVPFRRLGPATVEDYAVVEEMLQ